MNYDVFIQHRLDYIVSVHAEDFNEAAKVAGERVKGNLAKFKRIVGDGNMNEFDHKVTGVMANE